MNRNTYKIVSGKAGEFEKALDKVMSDGKHFIMGEMTTVIHLGVPVYSILVYTKK